MSGLTRSASRRGISRLSAMGVMVFGFATGATSARAPARLFGNKLRYYGLDFLDFWPDLAGGVMVVAARRAR